MSLSSEVTHILSLEKIESSGVSSPKVIVDWKIFGDSLTTYFGCLREADRVWERNSGKLKAGEYFLMCWNAVKGELLSDGTYSVKAGQQGHVVWKKMIR
jgi:hypothetical protein